MRVVSFILFIALFSPTAYALAVAADHLEGDILLLEDGKSKLYGIRLQNPGEEEIQLQLTYDNTKAEVLDYKEIYAIPPKTNYPVFFNISSKSFGPGDEFTIGYTVHQLSVSGPGVPLLFKINKNFKVRITKNPDKFYVDELKQFIPQAIVVLMIILAILVKKFGIEGIIKKLKSMTKKKK